MNARLRLLTFTSGLFVTSLCFYTYTYANTDMVYSQSGEVKSNKVVLWGRCNSEQPAELHFKVSPIKDTFLIAEDRRNYLREKTRQVSDETDFTASVTIRGLKPNTKYYYQVQCQHAQSTHSGKISSFNTAENKNTADSVRFTWVADLGGQGWGRNPNMTITHVNGDLIKGGYVIFDTMSRLNPDFSLFQGDMIYADNAIPPSKEIPADVGGGIWINQPAKDYVAITLDEYRANWKYNLGDEKMSNFLANTPIYVQWDDHEVTNNWYPGEIMPEGAPYNGMPVDTLAENAWQALFEYNPIIGTRLYKHTKLYRSVQHGKHLEVFLLDERSFRDQNPDNYDPNGIEMLGKRQFRWLKSALKRSKATWKVISTHDPLSIVTGGENDRDSWGQNEAAVLGREIQLANILAFIKDHDIKNVVYLTSDVHFTAAISYDPALATFKDFTPFWEFVIGPIHAGAFGPGNLDASFGPQYEYLRAPGTESIGQNAPPPNLQSFGMVDIAEDGALTVKLIDITGATLFEKTMLPVQ